MTGPIILNTEAMQITVNKILWVRDNKVNKHTEIEERITK